LAIDQLFFGCGLLFSAPPANGAQTSNREMGKS